MRNSGKKFRRTWVTSRGARAGASPWERDIDWLEVGRWANALMLPRSFLSSTSRKKARVKKGSRSLYESDHISVTLCA